MPQSIKSALLASALCLISTAQIFAGICEEADSAIISAEIGQSNANTHSDNLGNAIDDTGDDLDTAQDRLDDCTSLSPSQRSMIQTLLTNAENAMLNAIVHRSQAGFDIGVGDLDLSEAIAERAEDDCAAAKQSALDASTHYADAQTDLNAGDADRGLANAYISQANVLMTIFGC